jgi:sugar (pentulose or hexulose) kinase
MTAGPVAIGLDLGTTSFKALAVDRDGVDLMVVRSATPWREVKGVRSMAGADVLSSVHRLLVDVSSALEQSPVGAIGVTGMAEAGFILGPAGDLRSDAISWNDPGGAAEAADLQRQFGATLVRHTGLALPERCSAVKIRWLTGHVGEPGLSWANIPEWVVWKLGGARASELSLAARTGMLDVRTRSWWLPLVKWAGLDPMALPPPVLAGTALGRAGHDLGRCTGAVLTIGGHDHLCAAVGAGAFRDRDAFDSFGTGEAVLRSVPSTRSGEDCAVAVQARYSRGPHVLPDRDCVMAALGSGRLLHDVLRHLGVGDGDRSRLDVEAADEDGEAALQLSRELFDENGYLRHCPSSAHPGRVWRAALEYTARRCRNALEGMDRLYGPYAELRAAGGWFRSPFIRSLRERAVGPAQVPLTSEAGARGAARLAAVAAALIPNLSSWADSRLEALT